MAEGDRTLISSSGLIKPRIGTGSLSRRMIIIAAAWISLLLLAGGIALDRVLTNAVSDNFDDQMEYVLTAMIASSEIGPDGEIRLNRPLGDQRFLEPNSGLYYQISGQGKEPWPSRSLWDRTLKVDYSHDDTEPHFRNSDEFQGEPLRILERVIVLPDSDTRWIFMVAASRESLDAQITELRTVLATAFAVLAFGLIILAALQTFYGLWPLRDVRREIAAMRSGRQHRLHDALPDEVMPMVNELNALLDHNEKQAEEARRHAGNLAHALKTPLTVIMNSATAQAPDLAETVIREATTMRRQVDHHLARARAVGRRGHSHSRAEVWQSLESVERAVGRLYRHVRLDMAGSKDLAVRVERQDLDEMLGNLVENAAKYGGGSVFVTVEDAGDMARILIEDDGRGIPEVERARIFDRGVRLDTSKPGTGLGMAIVRDVAEIYNGSIELDESEDMGGLLVRLELPKAAS
ncbi:MAG: sensor histidine kinase [Sphingomonadales bacterium]|jgi:signal transduction histidine kinase|nr:sensor histidine kinase [Sphingomonadales bacterium]